MPNMKKPAPKRTTGGVVTPPKKITGKPVSPSNKKLMPKQLTGKEAVDALQKRVSPSGVKKAESGAKKAIDKKYPGLYKKSK
jgi:hypothetical protein